jgi:uncharacterized protein YhdP
MLSHCLHLALLGCARAAHMCGLSLRWLLRAVLVLYFVFGALFLVVRYAVMPNVGQYKAQVERSASESIGRPISIGALNTDWSGFNPQLSLRNVVILDDKNIPALQLPQVSASVSWLSVLRLQWRFADITITQPTLNVQRLADGSLYVGGFLVNVDSGGDPQGLDWLLAQREINVRGATLYINDAHAKTPALKFNDVNISLQNQWRHHRFAITAVPPTELAAPLDVRGDFQHPLFSKNISDFSQWSGEAYGDLQRTDFAALLAMIQPYAQLPIELSSGGGAVRAWGQFEKGELVDVTADLTLNNVSAKLGKDLPQLELDYLQGRVAARETRTFGAKYLRTFFGQTGHRIELENFSMRTRTGLTLPPTNFTEIFSAATKTQPESVEIATKLLDLQTLANFAEHLPLPEDQRQMLTDLAPRGQLKDFSASWQGSYPDFTSYKVKGSFIDLGLAPRPAQPAHVSAAGDKAPATSALPGFDKLSGSIDATDKAGRIVIDTKNLDVKTAGIFVDPAMLFERLKLQATWDYRAVTGGSAVPPLPSDKSRDHLYVKVTAGEFQQGSLRGTFAGQHLFPLAPPATKTQTGLPQKVQSASVPSVTEQLGEVDFTAKLNGFELKHIARFLPADAPQDLRFWLGNALLDGRLDDLSVRIKGELGQFPFVTPDGKPMRTGEFLVKGKIVDGKLNFAPDMFAADGVTPHWPIIDQVKGTIVFDHGRMEIKADSARTMGATISKVTAIIPDLVHANTMLNIDGVVSGGLQQMANYVNISPVNEWLGRFLNETKATGNAQLALQLNLPLIRLDDSKAHGVLNFFNNEISLQPGLPLLSAVNGKLDFTEKGVTLNGLRGYLLGGATTASGGSLKDGSVRVKLDGLATAEGMKKVVPADVAAKLNTRLSGATRYSATITVKKHQPDIVVESNLQGLALDFPAPLRKAANESLPSRFDLLTVASNDSHYLRDEIKIALGSDMAARYARRKSVDDNASWQMLRGAIAVNSPMPDPQSGLAISVQAPSVSVDDWLNLLSADAPATPNSSVNKDAVADNSDTSAYLEPDVLSLRANELHVLGKKIDRASLAVTRNRSTWKINVDSTQANGNLSWSGSGSNATLSARLSKLIISSAPEKPDSNDAKKTSDALRKDVKDNTDSLPNLDIIADNFEMGNKKFGHLELQATNVVPSSSKEWRINKLLVKNEDGDFKATGKWIKRNGTNLSDLSYQLTINDAGKLLDRIGLQKALRGGKGKLEGELQWQGLPSDFDTQTLSGQVKLDLKAGQFLKVEPGAAKMLGVLSMQSLTRRLTLDFRDVFSDGFAFDAIVGNAQITHGVAKTDNFKMSGVNAAVLIDGTADIHNETQNLHVVVIPEVNAGTASVMYGLAVNPAIGVGTFLAQLFLRAPLARAFTYEYQVTGAWADPVVTKYENKQLPASATTK